MSIIKPDNGGHWYAIGDKCGHTNFAIPRYDATLREARKEFLLPSVTTVDREKSNFKLDSWKQEQLLMAALTLPALEGESLDERIKRIVEDSKEHGKNAAEMGDVFHNIMERFLVGGSISIESYDEWIREGFKAVCSWIDSHVLLSEYVEQPFACTEYGYACRIDWAGYIDGAKALIDFKTQGTKPGKKVNVYDSWARQLAANAMAMPHKILKHINIVVSTTEPGRIEIIEWPEDKIRQGWLVFYHLLQVFTLSRNMGEWNTEAQKYV